MTSGGRGQRCARTVNPYAERHGKQITRSTEPLKQRFSIPLIANPRSAYFACLSLITHRLIRSELRALTVFRLTWSVVDKSNLEQISCLLKLLHGQYTVSIAPYSLSRGNPLKFTSLRNIPSRISESETETSHTQAKLTREA